MEPRLRNSFGERLVAAYPEQSVDINNANLFYERYRGHVLDYNGGFVIYLRLSDATFSFLKKGLLDILDMRILERLFKENGDNIHVITCVAKGVKMLKSMADRLGGKSLSWFSRDMKRLIVFEKRR